MAKAPLTGLGKHALGVRNDVADIVVLRAHGQAESLVYSSIGDPQSSKILLTLLKQQAVVLEGDGW